jgi:hypothetical protein
MHIQAPKVFLQILINVEVLEKKNEITQKG